MGAPASESAIQQAVERQPRKAREQAQARTELSAATSCVARQPARRVAWQRTHPMTRWSPERARAEPRREWGLHAAAWRPTWRRGDTVTVRWLLRSPGVFGSACAGDCCVAASPPSVAWRPQAACGRLVPASSPAPAPRQGGVSISCGKRQPLCMCATCNTGRKESRNPTETTPRAPRPARAHCGRRAQGLERARVRRSLCGVRAVRTLSHRCLLRCFRSGSPWEKRAVKEEKGLEAGGDSALAWVRDCDHSRKGGNSRARKLARARPPDSFHCVLTGQRQTAPQQAGSAR
jgi:hypothetical protein